MYLLSFTPTQLTALGLMIGAIVEVCIHETPAILHGMYVLGGITSVLNHMYGFRELTRDDGFRTVCCYLDRLVITGWFVLDIYFALRLPGWERGMVLSLGAIAFYIFCLAKMLSGVDPVTGVWSWAAMLNPGVTWEKYERLMARQSSAVRLIGVLYVHAGCHIAIMITHILLIDYLEKYNITS